VQCVASEPALRRLKGNHTITRVHSGQIVGDTSQILLMRRLKAVMEM
jgi:hypothetical protein